MSGEQQDPGLHYRYTYKGIKLDPARIALIYGGMSGMPFTILKKVLRMGTGAKDKRQDLLDIISAAQRELELMDEDENIPAPKIVVDNVCNYPDCNCPIEKPFDYTPCFKGLLNPARTGL